MSVGEVEIATKTGREHDEGIQVYEVCDGHFVDRICLGNAGCLGCRDNAAFRTRGNQRSLAIFFG